LNCAVFLEYLNTVISFQTIQIFYKYNKCLKKIKRKYNQVWEVASVLQILLDLLELEQ